MTGSAILASFDCGILGIGLSIVTIKARIAWKPYLEPLDCDNMSISHVIDSTKYHYLSK